LVRELIDHLLQVVDRDLGVILENVVVDWTSSALNGRMSAEIEVILKWMSDIVLNKGTGKGILVLVTSRTIILLRKEADVMTLGADNNGPLDLF
jgi:hypothetical protein